MVLEKLMTEMKTAMKAGEKDRLSVIKMLINEVKKEEKVSGKKRSQDDVVLAYLKKLKKAVNEYPPERRSELESEIRVVEEFAPKMMERDEIIQFIKDNVEDVSMRSVMPLLKGKADGNVVKDIVINWNKKEGETS